MRAIASSAPSAGQLRTAAFRNADAPPITVDALRLSQAALIVLGISRIHQTVSWMGSLHPAMLLAAIALLSAFLDTRRLADPGWMSRWTTRVIAGLALVSIGSMAFGISLGGSFHEFSDNYSKVIIGSLLLAATIRSARDLWFFVWAYLIGAAILVWMALFVFHLSVADNGMMRLDNLYTWDANDIGVLLLIALPLCLLAFRTSGSIGKTASAIVLVGIGAAIARSGSRGAFLGFGVVMLAFITTMKGTSVAKRLGVVLAVFLAITIAAPKGYWRQMNTITDAEQDYNWDAAQGRRQLAIRGLHYMLQYPAFGIGLDNFGRAEGTISDLALHDDGSYGVKWSAAHNSYIQAGAELGIPGFLLFCTLVAGCIIVPFRLRRRIPDVWGRGSWSERFMYQASLFIPLAAIGFAVTSFFVSFAYHDPIYILAAMTGALSSCVESELRTAGRTQRAPGASPLMERTPSRQSYSYPKPAAMSPRRGLPPGSGPVRG